MNRPLSPSNRSWCWAAYVVVLLIAPLLFRQNAALSLLSQMGTMILLGLSCNMLLGQGGMLSFGHAVYSGLGAFVAIHALNRVSDGSLMLPVTLIPLVGGIAGMGFGMLFGYVTTRRAGTTFAMITLGMVELVSACALMFPGFFGGEIVLPKATPEAFAGATPPKNMRGSFAPPGRKSAPKSTAKPKASQNKPQASKPANSKPAPKPATKTSKGGVKYKL